MSYEPLLENLLSFVTGLSVDATGTRYDLETQLGANVRARRVKLRNRGSNIIYWNFTNLSGVVTSGATASPIVAVNEVVIMSTRRPGIGATVGVMSFKCDTGLTSTLDIEWWG